jgi:hypothetical protein
MKNMGWLIFGIGLASFFFVTRSDGHLKSETYFLFFSTLMICGAIFAVGGAVLNFLTHREEGKQKLSTNGRPLE